MSPSLQLLVYLLVISGALALAWRTVQQRRADVAESAAARWLTAQGYRVRQLAEADVDERVFGAAPDDAFGFRAVVEHPELGGAGEAWLQVRVSWLGAPVGEPDARWAGVPNQRAADAAPVEVELEPAHLLLLGRVASGERTFRPDAANTPESNARFDLLVEQLLAMHRRRLVRMKSPVAELSHPTREFALVTDVSLTDDGRRAYERHFAGLDPTHGSLRRPPADAAPRSTTARPQE